MKQRPVLLFCFVFALVSDVVAQNPNPQPWFPANYRVVFESDVGGDLTSSSSVELFIANADGSELQGLTSNSVYDGQAAWSPDGNLIAFVSYRNGDSEIYVMNADGSNVRRLTDSPDLDYGPKWSPDGTTIAFTSLRTGDYEIYLMNSDGSNVRNITNHPSFDTGPNWSPNGSQIAFSSSRNGTDAIYVMGNNGLNVELVIESERRLLTPVWSPDGSRLAYFSAAQDRGYDIHVLNLLTGENIQFPRGDHGGGFYNLAWSPDGEILSYDTQESGYQIFFYQLSTGTEAQFSWFQANSSGLAWRPETVEDAAVTPTPSPG